ncbi:GMC family oxidoreductase [Lewinella sp. 4G2]|uniref:GMC family oxidoreductase n=1 Tax=Lewinella sp. 4G2 TaxID=1803372 RepID=UPI0007B4E847|nr:GMC family oxidoreductase N-terminal domain-containing protein [Lewinella sp. 4G2]OAV43261.1 choline dehydrogenase [Lewinella sp. 4G2]
MQPHYDYIIVGAGSAGSLLAARLSEDPATTVLLVEAGGPAKSWLIDTPGAYMKLHKSKYDWGFWSEPQEQLLNRRLYLPRGKVLGGSSSTNAMAYVRGNRADYDDWAALGNKGWSYDDVLPYFKKSEDNENLDDAYHGRGGELRVSYPNRFRTPFSTAFIEACVQSGFRRNDDTNGAEQAGAGLFQFTIRDGKRESGYTAFLKPAMRRPNLTVVTGTHTTEIIIEKDRAIGIRALTQVRGKVEYRCRKEVLLAAGAFGSPQLLMVSGVGAREELEGHGIACKVDLPGVGKNLQDHLFVPVGCTAKQNVGQNTSMSLFSQAKSVAQYYLAKTGFLNIGPLEAVAYGSTSLSPDRVDFQFQFSSFHMGPGYTTDFHDYKTFPQDQDGFSILPSLLRPKSRGTVSLSSKDPLDPPVIQPNFFAEEDDRKVMVEAVRRAADVLAAPAFDVYRDRALHPQLRTSASAQLATNSIGDSAAWEHVQKQVETIYHPVGTCKMGHDAMAVVDDELRVRGVEGLRVIDASIMPTIVSGNTNAAVYMIAERGSALVL